MEAGSLHHCAPKYCALELAPLLQLLPLSMYSSAESCFWSSPLLYLVVFAVHFGVCLLFLGWIAATVQRRMCLELEAIFCVCYTPSIIFW
jgi:hypothetical protein